MLVKAMWYIMLCLNIHNTDKEEDEAAAEFSHTH